MKNSKSETHELIVVGAGLSGLAVACRAAAKGYQVTVFEQSETFGGKAGEMKLGDYTFDTGPSLFTQPDYVDEVFTACGKNPRDYYSYTRLDTLCQYFFADGTFIRAPKEIDAFADEINRKMSDSKDSVKKFLSDSRRIHSLTEHVFIRSSLHRLSTYLRWSTFLSILQLGRVKVFRTMVDDIRRYFKDERTIQLFSRYATYNGSNPYQAPATLNVIPHLEFGLGAYMPAGGIRAIPQALYGLAQDMGVKFQFGQRVDEIMITSGQVRGVKVGENSFPADRVVCNVDVVPAYRKLMAKQRQPEKTLNQERSSSALIFYWGMASNFPQLDVHNIFFSKDYKKEFEAMFESRTIDDDPTVYVHVSSKVCPEQAPKGGENWFVMVNAPKDDGQDWPGLVERTRANILKKLNPYFEQDLNELIAYEAVLDPPQIDQKTGSFKGSLYGTSSNNRYAAFLRHKNFSSETKGLYFCGGSVHPGGGIPMVMSSARIVSEML